MSSKKRIPTLQRIMPTGQRQPSRRDLRLIQRYPPVVQARNGIASIDYVLVLAIILPLATFLFLVIPRMIQLVYEMTITMLGSPLM